MFEAQDTTRRGVSTIRLLSKVDTWVLINESYTESLGWSWNEMGWLGVDGIGVRPALRATIGVHFKHSLDSFKEKKGRSSPTFRRRYHSRRISCGLETYRQACCETNWAVSERIVLDSADS